MPSNDFVNACLEGEQIQVPAIVEGQCLVVQGHIWLKKYMQPYLLLFKREWNFCPLFARWNLSAGAMQNWPGLQHALCLIHRASVCC